MVDLGSGGGFDALLAAKRVGEAGKVFGIDMTEVRKISPTLWQTSNDHSP